VHATADGAVVVIHDETVDRTTDGAGLVRKMTLEALQQLDAGHHFRTGGGDHPFRGRGLRVPTLDELLERFPDTPVNIEIKQGEPAIETAVLSVLDRHAARERTLLAAEDAVIMSRIREAAPRMLTSFSAPEVAKFFLRLLDDEIVGYDAPGVALQVPPAFGGTRIITSDLIRSAHELGLEVHAWTINSTAEMEELIDLGVDGIMTDFPALGAAVLRARGLR
jgi:glycerophosphoryl diester phosphodiesterase